MALILADIIDFTVAMLETIVVTEVESCYSCVAEMHIGLLNGCKFFVFKPLMLFKQPPPRKYSLQTPSQAVGIACFFKFKIKSQKVKNILLIQQQQKQFAAGDFQGFDGLTSVIPELD